MRQVFYVIKVCNFGLLSFKPQTGYEIKANFNQSIRYLWNADQTHIYRALSEIAAEGLAVSKIIQQNDRPNKKVYKLTNAGKEKLKSWLLSTVKPKNQRNAVLLQIFFSGQIKDEDILRNLKHLRINMESTLSGLSDLENIPRFSSNKIHHQEKIIFSR